MTRRERRAAQRGFTLTEMMVVVVIFSVLATVALMSIGRGRKTGELDGFARAIQRSITIARRRAIDTGHRYLVDVRQNSVAYCELPPAAPNQATCPSAVGLESPQPYQAPSSVAVLTFARAADYDRTVTPAPPQIAIGGGASLYFLPNGSCDSDIATAIPDGFTAYLAVPSDPLQKRAVSVVPLTAKTRITDNW